jgi:hypothetical protein
VIHSGICWTNGRFFLLGALLYGVNSGTCIILLGRSSGTWATPVPAGGGPGNIVAQVDVALVGVLEPVDRLLRGTGRTIRRSDRHPWCGRVLLHVMADALDAVRVDTSLPQSDHPYLIDYSGQRMRFEGYVGGVLRFLEVNEGGSTKSLSTFGSSIRDHARSFDEYERSHDFLAGLPVTAQPGFGSGVICGWLA